MSEENIEVLARQDGWVPKEEYRGDESKWVDAETFVERGKQILPILRSNNERLKKELAEKTNKFEIEITELRSTAEEFKRFTKEAADRKVKEMEKQLRELRAAKSEATAQEDHSRAAELEEQIDSVKDQVAKAKEPPKEPEKKEEAPPELPAYIQEWMGKNTWYGDETDYFEESQIVTALGAAIRRKHPTITGKDFLEMLDDKIAEKLPHLVKDSARRGPSVEGGNRANKSKPSKRSYENLPADAKAACDKFVKQGLLTKEQYVADFDGWEE